MFSEQCAEKLHTHAPFYIYIYMECDKKNYILTLCEMIVLRRHFHVWQRKKKRNENEISRFIGIYDNILWVLSNILLCVLKKKKKECGRKTSICSVVKVTNCENTIILNSDTIRGTHAIDENILCFMFYCLKKTVNKWIS